MLIVGHEMAQRVTADWSDLGLSGTQTLHDLWQQKDIGEFETTYSATVPRHGVLFLRFRKS